jgi:hypothetical protein
MSTIFLDIDGVLNSTKSIEENYLKGNKVDAAKIFIPQSVFLINMLTSVKSADVVISSTWRYNMEKVIEVFKKNNLKTRNIVGRTPFLESTRGAEIKKYLKLNKNIEDFIIIDDDRDMEPFLDRLIHVKRKTGFDNHDYIKSLKMLGGKNVSQKMSKLQ